MSGRRAENSTIVKTGSTRNQALWFTLFMGLPRERLARDEVAVGIDVQLLEIECERPFVPSMETASATLAATVARELDPRNACPPDILQAPHLHRNSQAFWPQLDKLRPYADLNALVFRKGPISPTELDRIPSTRAVAPRPGPAGYSCQASR